MAAENDHLAEGADRRELASMRPRRMAAENLLRSPRPRSGGRGFNEAAAHGRGKRSSAAAAGTGLPTLQ